MSHLLLAALIAAADPTVVVATPPRCPAAEPAEVAWRCLAGASIGPARGVTEGTYGTGVRGLVCAVAPERVVVTYNTHPLLGAALPPEASCQLPGGAERSFRLVDLR